MVCDEQQNKNHQKPLEMPLTKTVRLKTETEAKIIEN